MGDCGAFLVSSVPEDRVTTCITSAIDTCPVRWCYSFKASSLNGVNRIHLLPDEVPLDVDMIGPNVVLRALTECNGLLVISVGL